jgi:alpha-acetolactate decarboxylase
MHLTNHLIIIQNIQYVITIMNNFSKLSLKIIQCQSHPYQPYIKNMFNAIIKTLRNK